MIDRRNPLPLYHQIAQDLRSKIDSGALRPGHALPTEETLQRMYGVSRATVRQAIRELVSGGLVRTERPRGMFVTEARLIEQLPRLISFSEEVRRAGLTASARVLSAALETPPDQVRAQLRLLPHDLTLRVARLRLADDDPVAVLTSWLPASVGISFDQDFSGSLYGLLAERGMSPARADQFLDAANASNATAALLEVPRRTALLVVTRTTYDTDGRAIEYVVGEYRADRYRYSIELSVDIIASRRVSGLVRSNGDKSLNLRIVPPSKS